MTKDSQQLPQEIPPPGDMVPGVPQSTPPSPQDCKVQGSGVRSVFSDEVGRDIRQGPAEKRTGPRTLHRLLRAIRRAVWPGLLFLLGIALGNLFLGRPGYRPQGSLMWIDGRSYIDATAGLQAIEKKVRSDLARSMLAEHSADGPRPAAAVVGMAAAPPPPDRRERLAVGQRLKTGDRRCEVLLDDGTRVFLNRNSAIACECRGELSLLEGEIYLEHRYGASPEPANPAEPGEPRPGFVVNLPNGEVVVWNAKVDLRVEGDAVEIHVVRGKAHVADKIIAAGHCFTYRGDQRISESVAAAVRRPLAAIAWTGGVESASLPAVTSPAGAAFTGPRDWIFVVECSGSQTPQLARTGIEIVRRLMDFAEDGDTAALIVAGTKPRVLASYRLDATPETCGRMVQLLERTHLVGGLDLERAFDAALPLIAAARNPVLVHVGRGRPTLGQCDAKALAAKIPGAARYLGVEVAQRKDPTNPKAAITPDDDLQGRIVGLLDALDQGTQPQWIGGIADRADGPTNDEPLAAILPERYCLPGSLADLKCWPAVLMAANEHHAGRLDEAEGRLQQILAGDDGRRSPMVWRMAARLAEERGRFGRAVGCREKVVELEAAALRGDYERLFLAYGKVARTLAELEIVPPEDLVARIIRSADRWRELDSDPTPACHAAARVLGDLGAKEEAWEYTTTPAQWKAGAEHAGRGK